MATAPAPAHAMDSAASACETDTYLLRSGQFSMTTDVPLPSAPTSDGVPLISSMPPIIQQAMKDQGLEYSSFWKNRPHLVTITARIAPLEDEITPAYSLGRTIFQMPADKYFLSRFNFGTHCPPTADNPYSEQRT
ncbi:hypothetical protein AK812_SmicGene30605 [Symbiodinium microadriaticum]|uniref:Uncharacterized protein n=1 Tax=Symbiodinium microadriaticum TaxID=2951 RepID=A0A1Q9CYT1_SYMMI|nr:hypothetical protein AK812_SmicGene30605 [Symbiodinium microadriaticum]